MELFFSEKDISDQDIKQIIRPNKLAYSLSDLGNYYIYGRQNKFKNNVLKLSFLNQKGPISKNVKGVMMERKDFQVINTRQEKLQCSIYIPQSEKQSQLIVIYLHGNSGCRLEANPTISHLIPHGYHVCSYDSSGCGLSEGNYVTLGINEKDDLHCVINKLKQEYGYASFILWGRSMGAVTSLLYCLQMQGMLIQAGGQVNNINGVVGLVIDSAFSNFENLTKEIAEKKLSSFLVKIGMKHLRNKLKSTLNGIDLFDIDLTHKVSKLKLPIIFAYTEEDTLILPYHTKILYDNYGGPKQKTQFKGNHNAMRDSQYYISIISFINNYLQHYKFSNKTLNNIEDYIFNKLKQPSKLNLTSGNSFNQTNNSLISQHVQNSISSWNFNKVPQDRLSHRQQIIKDDSKQYNIQQINNQYKINNQKPENLIDQNKIITHDSANPFFSPSTSPFKHFKSLAQSVQSLSHQPSPIKSSSFYATQKLQNNQPSQIYNDNKRLSLYQSSNNQEQQYNNLDQLYNKQEAYQYNQEQHYSKPKQNQNNQSNFDQSRQFLNNPELFRKNKMSNLLSIDSNSNINSHLNYTSEQKHDYLNYKPQHNLQSSSNSPILMANTNTHDTATSFNNTVNLSNYQQTNQTQYAVISPYVVSGQVKIPEKQDNYTSLIRSQSTSFYNDPSLLLSFDNLQNNGNRTKPISSLSRNTKFGSIYQPSTNQYQYVFPKSSHNYQMVDRITLK